MTAMDDICNVEGWPYKEDTEINLVSSAPDDVKEAFDTLKFKLFDRQTKSLFPALGRRDDALYPDESLAIKGYIIDRKDGAILLAFCCLVDQFIDSIVGNGSLSLEKRALKAFFNASYEDLFSHQQGIATIAGGSEGRHLDIMEDGRDYKDMECITESWKNMTQTFNHLFKILTKLKSEAKIWEDVDYLGCKAEHVDEYDQETKEISDFILFDMDNTWSEIVKTIRKLRVGSDHMQRYHGIVCVTLSIFRKPTDIMDKDYKPEALTDVQQPLLPEIDVSPWTYDRNLCSQKGNEYTIDDAELKKKRLDAAYHVHGLLNDMEDHQYRRYKPKEFAFGKKTDQLAATKGCEGIFEPVILYHEAIYVYFCISTNEVIGEIPRVLDFKFENGGITYGDDEDIVQKCNAFYGTHLERDDITIGIKCAFCNNGALCCDLMHTKVRKNNERFDTSQREEYQTHDKKAPQHNFEPELREIKGIRTVGYELKCEADTYVQNWFSMDYNAHNFVASTNKLSLIDQTTKRIKEDILAPRYILEPNEHIFVFLDGVLVCDSNIVDVPRFFPHAHPFLKSGKYNMNTLNVFNESVFRAQSFEEQIKIIQQDLNYACKLPTFEGGLDDETYCTHCGLIKDDCIKWQRDLLYEQPSNSSHVSRVAIEKWYSDEHPGEKYVDVIDQRLAAFRGERPLKNRDSKCYAHVFGSYLPLQKSDCLNLGQVLDCGVGDDVLSYQFDDENYWTQIKLPSELKVDGDRWWEKEMHRLIFEFKAQIGRLMYRCGEFVTSEGQRDTWQTFFFILGVAQSGKSTYQEFVSCVIPERDIGILDPNTFEKTFGMKFLLYKKVVMCGEFTDSGNFRQEQLQQFVDGSSMAAPVKGGDAKFNRAEGHLWIVGNRGQSPGSNAAGQISRRQVLVRFQKELKNSQKDPQLKQKFKHLYLGHNIVSWYCCYWSTMENHSNKDIWNSLSNGPLSQKFPGPLCWIWHRQKELEESQASLLQKALTTFRNQKDEWYFSPKRAVNIYRRNLPTTGDLVYSPNGYYFIEDLDHPKWKNWTRSGLSDHFQELWNTIANGHEDYSTFQFNDASGTEPLVVIPPLFYMPLDARFKGHKDKKEIGFKDRFNDFLQVEVSTGTKIDPSLRAWKMGSDFYDRDFRLADIFVHEGYLPHPPGSNKFYHGNWLCGITNKQYYQIGGQEQNMEAFSALLVFTERDM